MRSLSNTIGTLGKKIWIILGGIVLIVLSAVVVAFAGGKKSDPSPEPDAIASYYDDDPEKVLEKEIKTGSEQIVVKYIRTENLKTLPVEKRSDKYGTYDVYEDRDGTEYNYLLNSDVFCGFRKQEAGIPMDEKDAIGEGAAIQNAFSSLGEMGRQAENYVFDRCFYDDLRGYYEVSYYKCLGDYKTDDEVRIWVNSKGDVTAFSEFNYRRYDRVAPVTEAEYQRAEKDLEKQVSKLGQSNKVSVMDTYLALDDTGKLCLYRKLYIYQVKAEYTNIEPRLISTEIKR